METVGGLFALAVIIMAVGAAGSGMFKDWLKHREKKLEIEARRTAERAAQYAASNERLEQRVQVLERIVTDKGLEISEEIERLRHAPLN